MKAKRISELTPCECLDKLSFFDLKRVLARAKQQYKRDGTGLEAILSVLNDMCIDADSTPSLQPDAKTLKETVVGFLEGKYHRGHVVSDVRAIWERMDGEAYGV